MITLIGLLFALVNSFAETSLKIVTQEYKIDPTVLSIYRGLGLALVLLPFLIFIPYPTSPIFYLLVFANGLFSSVSTRHTMDVINKFGANISSKFLTIPPVIVAIVWWIIRPVDFVNYINADPYKAAGAIFCICGMIFTIFALGRSKYTKEALVESAPVFICYTFQTFLTFFALKEVNIIQAMFYYVFLQGLIVGIINYFLHIHHLKGHVKDDLLRSLFDRRVLKAGLLFVFAMVIARFSTNIAFKLLPNPTWVLLVANMQILWVYFAAKKLKLESVVSAKKGIILAIYAITFIILTY